MGKDGERPAAEDRAVGDRHGAVRGGNRIPAGIAGGVYRGRGQGRHRGVGLLPQQRQSTRPGGECGRPAEREERERSVWAGVLEELLAAKEQLANSNWNSSHKNGLKASICLQPPGWFATRLVLRRWHALCRRRISAWNSRR